MDIQRKVRDRTNGLHHRDAYGDVGHKQAVHNIHMDIVGGFNALNIPAEVGKVSRENGGCDLDHGEWILSHWVLHRTEPWCIGWCKQREAN